MNKLLLTIVCTTSIVNASVSFHSQSRVNHKPVGSCGVNFNLNLLVGSANKSYNGEHKKVSLLNMFGTHQLAFIGIQQNGAELTTLASPDEINDTWHVLDEMTTDTVAAIAAETDFGTYGQFDITGKLFSKKGFVSLVTPSYKGFYMEASLPFSSINFSNLGLIDLTPTEENGGFNTENTNLTNTIASLDDILREYNISPIQSLTKYSEKDIGDLEIDLHYSHKFNKIFQADFLAGIVFPTGKKRNENKLLSVAHGYDGHWGFKLGGTLEANLHEYISLQSSIETLLFARNTKTMRLKTYEGQNGFLFLASDKARRSKGPIVTISTQALMSCCDDHVSLSVGHLYTRSGKTTLTLKEDSLFDAAVANTDKRLDSWYRHSLQGSVIFSLNNIHENYFNPQLGFIFSIPVAGKNTFITQGYGTEAAVTVACEF